MSATRVLVLNSGSSTVKYRLLDMADGARLASGLVDRVGERDARLHHSPAAPAAPAATGRERTRGLPAGDSPYETALRAVADELESDGLGLTSAETAAVGHRVVHGGHAFTQPTLVDDAVYAEIERLVPLAPLHNPANLAGVSAARALAPGLPQVAVFDTAFHATMPEYAARYAVDVRTADEYDVRRYGFHGTSHAYVSRRTAELLERSPEETNVIVLHLGNGASASAVAGGRCVDTSMGLTPLEGLVMGTRSGDVDPAVVGHLVRTAGMSVDEVDELLNHGSGLAGLCGDGDMRNVLARIDPGDADGGPDGRSGGERDRAAQLAFDVYVHRLKKYIGAYFAVLGRVDAVAFTAGVGEHSAPVRKAAVEGLEELGPIVDSESNEAYGTGHGPYAEGPRLISPAHARTAVAVVPTDEEREIARETYALVTGEGAERAHAQEAEVR